MSLNIGEISFINFMPLAGMASAYPFDCNVKKLIPSELNAMCRRGELDISPISFYAYSQIEKNYELLPPFCIASDGEVMSVKLFSKFKISDLSDKKIYLTPDSESSVAAFCAICKKRYAYNPRDRACANIADADAVFLIGDKALAFQDKFDYAYDLGILWKETFQMPLIFAAVVVKRGLPESIKFALANYFRRNLEDFSANKDAYYAEAARRINSEKFGARNAEEYFGRLIFKMPEEAFEKSGRILNGKTD